MGIVYPSNDYRDYLEHHGVKGQKWGERKYQNLDGSLTELGREHYGVGQSRKAKGSSEAGSKLTAAQKALEKGPDGFKDTKSYLEAITKDCFSMSGGQVNYKNYAAERKSGNFSGVNKRINDAADLGLDALKRIDGVNTDIDTDGDRQGWREWFLWEDQTIGLPMVADLINRGYSAKQVNKLIDELEKNSDYSIDYSEEPTSLSTAMFDVWNGNWNDTLKGFAKTCEEIKKETESFVDKAARVPMPSGFEAGKEKTLAGAGDYKDAWVMSKEDQLKNFNDLKNYDERIKDGKLIPVVDTHGDNIIVYDTEKGTYSKYDWFNHKTFQEKQTLDEHFKKDANGKRVGIFEAYEDPDSEYYVNTKSKDSKQVKTEAKLANVNDKLDALEEKRNSPAFQKKLDKKAQIEKELEQLRYMTMKIRNKKLIYDKDPGFFDKLKLNKELKLEKQLAKINKETDKLNSKIDKLTSKQEKYKDVLDSFESNRVKGLSRADFDGNDVRVYKNDAATREAMRVAKAEGWDSLTKRQKELLALIG